jgi:hypothetical protein
MIRRRRRSVRETPFSLDSFLDLVTNVVGIIIRLILVAWVGARAYNTLPQLLKEKIPAAAEIAAGGTIRDPLEAELERQRQELAEAEARVLNQLRQLDLVNQARQKTEKELGDLAADGQELERGKSDLLQAKANKDQAKNKMTFTLAELETRRERLNQEMKDLEKLPPLKKTLRYRTPVSQTVHASESHFECRDGRVTFVDLDTMLQQIKACLRDKEKQLQTQWQVPDVTEPIGPFQMRYVIARGRSNLDAAFENATPAAFSSFSYGLSEWHVEPIDRTRGETAQAALAEGSEFRHIIDGLAVEKAAVTFWVYADSFPLYRKLRDYAVERGLTVAGRPLPDGELISGSPQGKKSRGQ